MLSVCNYNSEFSVYHRNGDIYIYEWLGDSVIREHILTQEETASLVRNLLNELLVVKYGLSAPTIKNINTHAKNVEIEYINNHL